MSGSTFSYKVPNLSKGQCLLKVLTRYFARFALLRSAVAKPTRFTFPARTASIQTEKISTGTRGGLKRGAPRGAPDVWTQLSPVTLVTTGRRSVTSACPPGSCQNCC